MLKKDALASCAQNPNVDISGVYDPNGMNDVTRYRHNDTSSFWFMKDPRFVAAPSHSFNPGREQDFMHNKLLIIDDSLVIIGSYNFSENAEANGITNETQSLRKYTDNTRTDRTRE